MPLISHGLTDPGCVRTENQDRIVFNDHLGLYIVCDGLGGRRRGDVAAELATNAIRQYVELSQDPMDVTWPYGYNIQMSLAGNRIATAAKLANRQVWRRSEEMLEYLGMGTTITAVLVDSGTAAIANIGDSRVYLFRDGHLEQLSVDDTVGYAQLRTREVALDESRRPLIRNVLTRAAGSQENADIHLKEQTLAERDILLLCSDGLYGCVSDEQVSTILGGLDDPGGAATALLSAARLAGAPDNVSVVVFQYRPEE
jgi:serine/threonine protein phosphatase PrpC